MRENIRNKGQSPIQYATIILVIVALVGSWMAYSSAGSASTKGLAKKEDVSSLKEDVSSLKEDVSSLKEDVSSLKEDVSSLMDQNATLRERIKALGEKQSSIMEKIGVTPPARLTATSISVPPVKAGETATAIITVINTGGKEGSKDISLKIEGETVKTKRITVPAGVSKTVSFDIRKDKPGNYTVSALGASASWSVRAKPTAKLTVTSVSAPSVKVGEKATVKVTVTNTGEKAGSMEVAPTIKGEEIGSKTVKLKPGETTDVEFTVRKEESGEYTIKADGKSTTLTVTGKTVTIGYITREANAWWEIAAAGFKAGAEAKGAKAQIYMPRTMKGGTLQASALREWVRLGTVDGIMVGPNVAEALEGPINEAMDEGIPVITGYGVDSPGSDRLAFIGYNPGKLGKALAASMAHWLEKYGHESGEVTYSTGSMASTEDVASYNGFANPLENEGYEVLDALVDKGSSEVAKRKAIEAIRTHPDIVGMQGYYDYTVPAIGDALKSEGVVKEIVGMGDGFTGEMIPYLRDGSIKATTALGKYPGSKLGAEMLVELARAPQDQWDDIVDNYVANPPKPVFYSPGPKKIFASLGLITSKPVEWKDMPEKLYGWKMTVDEFKSEYPGAWEIMVKQFK